MRSRADARPPADTAGRRARTGLADGWSRRSPSIRSTWSLRLDPIAAAEQAGQPGMPDRDVQPVRIIVGDGLPVERARPQRHPADRAQILEAVGRDLGLVRRHHLGDRRRAGLERHEQETVPVLERQTGTARACRSRAPDIAGAAARRPAGRRGRSSTRDRDRSAPWRSRASPSTSRDPRWRQTLVKARATPSSPRMTITLSPR